MAGTRRHRTRTESTCTTETARATHTFRIEGYNLHKGLGKLIRSSTFSVGGYDWCIRFYTDGNSPIFNVGYMSAYLELQSTDAEARAIFDLRLVNQSNGKSRLVFSKKEVVVFRCPGAEIHGALKFKKWCGLPKVYLKDDSLVIECDVTVIKETRVEKSAVSSDLEVHVPPSDLSDGLGKLLESGEEADVTIDVKGEVFHAHKSLLAIRSPVFKAELYGPMRDKEMKTIRIEDMEPDVFKSLLHFIYKDSLPEMDDLNVDEQEEMVKHLLVAADRYAVERMKLMCESLLCRRLVADRVFATLAIADQHHCSKLKDACIEYINRTDKIDDVLASKDCEQLKRTCPALFVDIWEKAAKCPRIY